MFLKKLVMSVLVGALLAGCTVTIGTHSPGYRDRAPFPIEEAYNTADETVFVSYQAFQRGGRAPWCERGRYYTLDVLCKTVRLDTGQEIAVQIPFRDRTWIFERDPAGYACSLASAIRQDLYRDVVLFTECWVIEGST